MKTLIFNGSARKNGDTQSLIEELVRQLEGETLIVDAHDVDVKACMDCGMNGHVAKPLNMPELLRLLQRYC